MNTITPPYSSLYLIHKKILSHFETNSILDNYGSSEEWAIPEVAYQGLAHQGNAHTDFALTCRKVCQYAKFPTRLLIASVNGEARCVLDCNGIVFDAYQSTPISREELHSAHQYQFQYSSGFDPSDEWTPL